MDPTQNISQGPIYLEKDQQPENLQNNPTTSPNKSNPILRIALAFFMIFSILLFITISVFLLFNKNEPKLSNAKQISKSGDFQVFRKDFESSIELKPVSFLGYDNMQDYRILNNSLNIDDVVRVGCSNWESDPLNPNKSNKKTVETLNIIYGIPGRSDFWSVSFIKEDLELNKTYYLPISLDSGPVKYGRIYVFYEYNEFNSSSYNSIGGIKINSFEGCDMGDEIEFEINAILGQNDENEDIYYELDHASAGIQIIGQFKSKVNVENGKSAYDILIPVEEHKTFLTKIEIAKKNRLESLKNEYIDEYGYDEGYDYYFDDYPEENVDIENEDEEISNTSDDTKKQSDVTQILNAIYAYKADNSSIPESITTRKQEISSDAVDLCDFLVGTYIPALPANPDYYSEKSITECNEYYETGYLVVLDSNDKITVSATGDSSDNDISVTR